MLAGEKEKMPVEFCGDAVNIVCCEPPAVDRTESNKSLVTDYFLSLWLSGPPAIFVWLIHVNQ